MGIFQKQLKNATIFVLIVFGILILRLWSLQILSGPIYRTRSEHNRIRLQNIPPVRGMILDRNQKILVDNRPAYNLYVIPEEMQDQKALSKNLYHLIGLDPETVRQQLEDAPRGRPFKSVCLKKDISRDEMGIIETHRFTLPGVIIQVEPRRHYVYGKLGFHLLGYLGQINETQLKRGQYPDLRPGDLIGKSGVEMKWQSLLNGTRGGEQVEVDAAGRKIRTISLKSPLPGANVCLTVDMGVQKTAEDALKDKTGAIVALDPNSGAVLALASSPAVDPNLFVTGIDKTTWQEISTSQKFPLQNRALTGQYPPASVFKIIVALAGLEEGVIDPGEVVLCPGYFFLAQHRFNCWKRYGHGEMDLHTALVQSCDVYFYQKGLKLGVDTIARYAEKFGFGKQPGLDLGQEMPGLIPTRDWKRRRFGVPWQGGETVSTAIGQSYLLVTPMQMAMMISAVFNGGDLYRPQVTQWVGKSADEKGYEFSPLHLGNAHIRKAHLETVKDALIGAVNEPHGTGAGARIKGVTVAGKTGTAQLVGLNNKAREGGQEDATAEQYKDHAWFVAVAPAEEPRIAVAIIIEHGEHGSAAAPIAKALLEQYLNIPG